MKDKKIFFEHDDCTGTSIGLEYEKYLHQSQSKYLDLWLNAEDIKYIDYYILLENTNGNFISIPSIDPYDVPISILIEEEVEEELLRENSIDYSAQPKKVFWSQLSAIAFHHFKIGEFQQVINVS